MMLSTNDTRYNAIKARHRAQSRSKEWAVKQSGFLLVLLVQTAFSNKVKALVEICYVWINT